MDAPPASTTEFVGTWMNVVMPPLFIAAAGTAASPLLLPSPLEDEGQSGAVLPVMK